MVFDNWNAAHDYAVQRANEGAKLDQAIRRVREFGRERFVVTFASRNDSDYARAEIVRAGDR